jgi:hypothetical protein
VFSEGTGEMSVGVINTEQDEKIAQMYSEEQFPDNVTLRPLSDNHLRLFCERVKGKRTGVVSQPSEAGNMYHFSEFPAAFRTRLGHFVMNVARLRRQEMGWTRIEVRREARRAYIARRRSLYVSLSTGDSLGIVSKIQEKKNLNQKEEVIR